MKAVIQRVKLAKVKVGDKVIAEIGRGLLVLLGIGKRDGDEDVYWLANKIVNLRIFEDGLGRFNYSLREVKGELLLISQFTLYADCRKGKRPSFDSAMPAPAARVLFEKFFNYLKSRYAQVKRGIFQEHMYVTLINEGPVTIILDTESRKKKFLSGGFQNAD